MGLTSAKAGDDVNGSKERIQQFQGTVIQRRSVNTNGETFTVIGKHLATKDVIFLITFIYLLLMNFMSVLADDSMRMLLRQGRIFLNSILPVFFPSQF